MPPDSVRGLGRRLGALEAAPEGELGRKVRPFHGLAGDSEEEHILETFPFQLVPSSALGRHRKFSSGASWALPALLCSVGLASCLLSGGREEELRRYRTIHATAPQKGTETGKPWGAGQRAGHLLPFQSSLRAQLLFQEDGLAPAPTGLPSCAGVLTPAWTL
ncbi:unnamed protein product [Rangifer tarandus platyrhynchus]|uniref:Uncharacterized protein n=1 Tax=Rangifer tarandus platyrhynchus TaxID=3082113 RepID=A0AC59Y1Q5_RANTA